MRERMIQTVIKYKKIISTAVCLLVMVMAVIVVVWPQSTPVEEDNENIGALEIGLLLENYRASYREGRISEDQYQRIVALLENSNASTVLLDSSLEEVLASIVAEEVPEVSTETPEQQTGAPTETGSGESVSGTTTNIGSEGTEWINPIDSSTEEVPNSGETDPEESDTEVTATEESKTEEPTEDSTEDSTEELTEPPTEAPDPRISVLDNYTNLAVVIAPKYLNVRDEPSMNGKVIGKLYKNSGVNLLEPSADGQWYHIVSNEVDGWINAEFIVTGEEAAALAVQVAFPGIKVDTRLLNVRSGPSTNDEIITQISRGSVFVVNGVEGEWIKIDLGEDEGYVHGDYIAWNYMLPEAVPYEEPIYVNPVRAELVNFAMEYLGGAYVWGGTKLGVGVDCSGFVLRVFEHFGYNLQRTAAYQARVDGVQISFEEMQPGDLIFYWSTKRNCVGHVGIYIGNGMMIHAASEARGIVIDRYDYMTPLYAKNIIGD